MYAQPNNIFPRSSYFYKQLHVAYFLDRTFMYIGIYAARLSSFYLMFIGTNTGDYNSFNSNVGLRLPISFILHPQVMRFYCRIVGPLFGFIHLKQWNFLLLSFTWYLLLNNDFCQLLTVVILTSIIGKLDPTLSFLHTDNSFIRLPV